MFYICSLKFLNISNFNISNVIEIFSMFYFCRSLTSLDLSNFNIENVIHIKNIFYSINKDCKIITE